MMIENFDPNCDCGGTRERPYPDDCERCQFVVALMAETKRADDLQATITRIAEAQRQHCETECIDGVWWAKGNGIVAGPQATEQDALLEVAEMGVRVSTKRAEEAEAECKRWLGLCEMQQKAVRATDGKRIAAEHARDEAEKRRCPIGLDASPQFCSAGSCDVCIGNRLRGLSEELTAAEQARDEAVREVERLREENKRLVDVICERNSEIRELEHAAEFAALLQPKEAGDES